MGGGDGEWVENGQEEETKDNEDHLIPATSPRNSMVLVTCIATSDEEPSCDAPGQLHNWLSQETKNHFHTDQIPSLYETDIIFIYRLTWSTLSSVGGLSRIFILFHCKIFGDISLVVRKHWFVMAHRYASQCVDSNTSYHRLSQTRQADPESPLATTNHIIILPRHDNHILSSCSPPNLGVNILSVAIGASELSYRYAGTRRPC